MSTDTQTVRLWELPEIMRRFNGGSGNRITMRRMTAIARGRVQGVGYRFYVTGCARKAGISGFVKNLPDGSVLIVGEGNDDALDTFAFMVQADSDTLIRVDELEVEKSKPTGEFSGFWIRW
jgi:acylphosphatase